MLGESGTAVLYTWHRLPGPDGTSQSDPNLLTFVFLGLVPSSGCDHSITWEILERGVLLNLAKMHS